MDFTSIPIILISCYLFGEIFKICFKKKKTIYKLVPLLVTIFGGLLSILIYYTEQSLLNVNNVYDALLIGFISGASSTGTNQIIKQIFISNKQESETDHPIDDDQSDMY